MYELTSPEKSDLSVLDRLVEWLRRAALVAASSVVIASGSAMPHSFQEYQPSAATVASYEGVPSVFQPMPQATSQYFQQAIDELEIARAILLADPDAPVPRSSTYSKELLIILDVVPETATVDAQLSLSLSQQLQALRVAMLEEAVSVDDWLRLSNVAGRSEALLPERFVLPPVEQWAEFSPADVEFDLSLPDLA